MDLVYWLMLLKTPHIGVTTFYHALKYFTEPKSIFDASIEKLQKSNIFKKESIDFIMLANKDLVATDLKWQRQKNCYIITLINDKYPEKLKQITDPPPILYVRGDINLLQQNQLAIVGSRNPTSGGSATAYKFAYELSNKIIITSGMASGIDTQAHLGALENGAKTIAVCGTGLDRIYPAKNKNIAKQIATTGALVSELPIGVKPLSANFPRRNRIISGMSNGVLIVEASIKSGSMISARLAIEQNREVFAIPSSINNPLSSGPHQLIKDGAALVDCVDDITNILNLTKIITKKSKETPTSDNVLLKYMNYDGVTIDEIALNSNLDIGYIIAGLLQLELSGVIEKQNNSTYILK